MLRNTDRTDRDAAAQSTNQTPATECDDSSDPTDLQVLDITRVTDTELLDLIASRLESQHRRRIEEELATEITAQSDLLTHKYGSTVSIDASSTEELRTLQEAVAIEEETLREMQAEAGLQRLHPSRREDFISQVLQDRIKAQAAERLDNEHIHSEAENQLAALFDHKGSEVTLTWTQQKNGSFRTTDDTEATAMTATIDGATTDLSDTALRASAIDVAVVADNAEVAVTSPIANQSFTLDRGAYKIRARSIRALAQDAGLIETDTRDATCTASDKDALDITVEDTETDGVTCVIELKSGNNGYSNRNTKGWTEYLDFDPDREIVLIRVGQTSFYRGSLRGKQERTWLVGREDEQVWTHQVYNTHDTIEAALDFMKPAEVQWLADKGRTVIRQGDVFFVEMIRTSNFDALEGTRHNVEQSDDDTVTITHPEHDNLELTGTLAVIVAFVVFNVLGFLAAIYGALVRSDSNKERLVWLLVILFVPFGWIVYFWLRDE